MIVLKNEKLFLNKDRFMQEMEINKGKVHPEVIHKGHHAKLDRQSDIAAILMVSRSTLGNWLNGSNNITESHARELANVFGCDWEYLVGKQEFRSRRGHVHSMMNKIVENFERAEENDEPRIDPIELECDKLVTCHHYPIDKLIRDIVYLGGYEQIIEGLKGISDFVKPRS